MNLVLSHSVAMTVVKSRQTSSPSLAPGSDKRTSAPLHSDERVNPRITRHAANSTRAEAVICLLIGCRDDRSAPLPTGDLAAAGAARAKAHQKRRRERDRRSGAALCATPPACQPPQIAICTSCETRRAVATSVMSTIVVVGAALPQCACHMQCAAPGIVQIHAHYRMLLAVIGRHACTAGGVAAVNHMLRLISCGLAQREHHLIALVVFNVSGKRRVPLQ